jgi:hypothetical protein
MAKEKRGIPRTQTSAPVKSPGTTEDPAAARRDDVEERRREAREEAAVRGDRMPKGGDEPGAGL